MERWITVLRDQAAQIAEGSYQPDPAAFVDAPTDIALLSEDLNAIAQAMAERDRAHKALTHEVHHRVKNNLQIVTSLLNLQARKIDDPVSRGPVEQARMRMGALALIHRLLYEQDDDNAAREIDAGRLMTELCAQLRLAHRDQIGIDFSCEANSQAVPLDNAVPLALLSVEAVTNAYAHAFREGRSGTVKLRFSVKDKHTLLRISDDGIGFDASSEFKSMGCQLMAAFAHQLRGKLDITSSKEAGTVVTLGYPLAESAPRPQQ